MQSMLESIRRSLDSPTPDMQVTRIQFESLAKIADIYFDQYEEMVWANSQLRRKRSEFPPSSGESVRQVSATNKRTPFA